MKELYISPELNVLCFAPVEHLATEDGVIDFGDLHPDDGVDQEVQSEEGDFDFDFFG